jgi:hypothetical protein
MLKGRMVGVGYLDLTGCMALGITGPVLRSTGLPHDLRKSDPYCGYETYDFDVVTRTGCDAYDRIRIRIDEMYQSLKIVEQALDRLQRTEGQPVMVADKKIAWPAQLAIGGDGMGNSLDHIREIMGTSMESLIHHFKLVTEGFRVPPVRRTSRWSRPRASSAATSSPTAAPGPTGRTSATRASTTCRPWPRCAKAARSPTSSSRSPPSTPSWEVSTADGDFGLQTASGHLHVSAESKEPYAADVEAQFRADAAAGHRPLPAEALGAAAAAAPRAERRRLRHRSRHRPSAPRLLDLTTAEVSGVATFYTQYKRHPNGDYTVGVCTNTLCASWAATRSGMPSRAPRRRPRRDHRGRQDHPRARRVQRRLRLRPGRHDELGVLRQPDARVHDPLVDDLHRRQARRARPAAPTSLCTFKEVSRGCWRASTTGWPTKGSALVRPRSPV